MHVTADVDDGAGAEGYKLVNEVFVAAFARRVDYNCSFVRVESLERVIIDMSSRDEIQIKEN